jgi:MFS family permease
VAGSPYARVLRAPSVAPMVAAALLARMPFGILGLALILFIREQTGSFTVAGAVSGVYALAAAASSPLLGRLFDRIGPARVLLPFGSACGVTLAALIVLGLADAPSGVLIAVAGVSGALTPPISPALRVLLRDVLGDDDELLTVSYALDAILLEMVFILGPVLAAAIVAVASPAAAVGAGVLCIVSGTLWFGGLPSTRGWQVQAVLERHPLGALASPGIRTLMLATLPIGICFGALEVTLTAFGREHGSGAIGGVAISVLSVGSAFGGWIYGNVASRRAPLRDLIGLLVALPAGFALLAVADSVPVMLALAPLAGLALAPLTTVENTLVPGLAPAGTLAESFTWLLTATVLGVAGGSAVAGVLVDASGWQSAQLACAAVGFAGAAVALALRRTLAPDTSAAGGTPPRLQGPPASPH